MVRMLPRVGILALCLTLATGCSIRLADFTVISTKSVELDRVDLDDLPKTENVTGYDKKLMLLFFPLGIPHIENAVDDALEKGNGDAMTDAVLYSSSWWFIVGQNILKVEGDVVNTRGK